MKPEIKSLIKDNLRKILIGIGFLLILMLIIRWLRLNIWQVIGLLSLINLLMSYKNFNLLRWLVRCLIIAGCILTIYYLRGFGAIGILIATLLIPVFILWKRWDRYMAAVKTCEKVIYGKTKEEMKKGEKRPKIKIGWRGKVKVK